ncbi:uncharacterized protein N7498_010568 [Penicillium cinerascens]|uniref:Uncharacterized protein n=1 Tax=Penicillium cinerascens TaxID=70096 RepID=A0A9W9J7P3_9EURO|nr:uncharacterized protein N7498_010568 [Penicillium cinerascens]KAJ5191583.1 hypothetical protein N7498_010568 [Penicillium cinerascens]
MMNAGEETGHVGREEMDCGSSFSLMGVRRATRLVEKPDRPYPTVQTDESSSQPMMAGGDNLIVDCGWNLTKDRASRAGGVGPQQNHRREIDQRQSEKTGVTASSFAITGSAPVSIRPSTSAPVPLTGIAVLIGVPLVSQRETPTGPSHESVANSIWLQLDKG